MLDLPAIYRRLLTFHLSPEIGRMSMMLLLELAETVCEQHGYKNTPVTHRAEGYGNLDQTIPMRMKYPLPALIIHN